MYNNLFCRIDKTSTHTHNRTSKRIFKPRAPPAFDTPQTINIKCCIWILCSPSIELHQCKTNITLYIQYIRQHWNIIIENVQRWWTDSIIYLCYRLLANLYKYHLCVSSRIFHVTYIYTQIRIHEWSIFWNSNTWLKGVVYVFI